MIRLKRITTGILLVAGIVSCTNNPPITEKQALLDNLKRLPEQGMFLFGHHDDPLYGINADSTGWEGVEGGSDVKSVCGDYPAVMSFDLGDIEHGGNLSLDKVLFTSIRKEILNQYARGGMVSISWHADNPLTGGDSWDVTDSTVVASVLPGGTHHEMFLGWLDRVADFMNSLQTPEGKKIPVLFRPWHEHTGSWFWWGQDLCTTEQYKALWKLTYDRLQEKGTDNLLYAYSPGAGYTDSVKYLERYPGDEMIDLLGFDCYQFNRDQFLADLDRSLSILTEVAKTHGKAMAITETGYEGIPDSTWWTQTLLPAIEKYPISYVLVWRNARERVTHYYAPYPGQVSAVDFMEFYCRPHTLFAADLKNLYSSSETGE